ncbi:MAG TPA: prepilin-type N-terminal cleavage/methylation domain-containing protein [bacterium]|nr:prepilin-type N-terminal cleavage/methylation domain-containing protein [bacterium]
MERRADSGFTLVELLTVVGIIVVLMALLIPSIYTAREKAKQAKCASNMRQLLIGLNLFEQENKSFPVFSNNGSLITNLSPAKSSGKPIYIDNYDVYHCPNHRYLANEHYSGEGHQTCYMCNDGGHFPEGGLSADHPDFVISQTVLLIDSINDAGASTEPRHAGGSNLGFADGHVEWYSKKAYTGTDPNGSKVGWKNWGYTK